MSNEIGSAVFAAVTGAVVGALGGGMVAMAMKKDVTRGAAVGSLITAVGSYLYVAYKSQPPELAAAPSTKAIT